jgi:type I site-specific restriction endonuclease
VPSWQRGEESVWREVLEYFDSATRLGLTATPKSDADVDTYGYFGRPLYSYSLAQGIQDGFLAPYRYGGWYSARTPTAGVLSPANWTASGVTSR